MVKVIKNVFDL